MTQRYRNWHIDYDPPPIPTRNCDWHFWHDDYDGAEDAGDNRCGYAASEEAAKAEIDDWYDDEFVCPRCRDASPDSCLALVCPDRVDWRGDTIIAHFNDLIPEGRANAHLMVAAPDMHEALTALMAASSEEEEFFAYRQARAALAKAEGRS